MELDILNTNEPNRDDHTEIGSYFVANYPPFSAWSAVHTTAAHEALARHVVNGERLHRGLKMLEARVYGLGYAQSCRANHASCCQPEFYAIDFSDCPKGVHGGHLEHARVQ